MLRRVEYRRVRACVRDARTETSGRVDMLGDTSTTKSVVVHKLSARRLPPRETDSCPRTRATNSDSADPHVRVLAPILIAAPFIGNSALLSRAHLPCYKFSFCRIVMTYVEYMKEIGSNNI